MKFKGKILAAAIVGALAIGFGSGAGYTPAATAYAAETVSTQQNANAEKIMSIVTDKSGSVLSQTDIQALSDEQSRIHKSGDVAVKYVFHTYIYDDSEKNVKDKSKELSDEYKMRGEYAPFIFVLNKSDGSYRFVEDTRLAPYVSSAYLSKMADTLFAGGKVNADTVREFVIRADSTIMMSVDGDFAFTGQMPVNEAATKEFVDIKNFSNGSDVGVHKEKEQEPTTSDEETKKQAENGADEGVIPALLAFVLAAGTIAFFVKKKKGGR